MKKGFTMIELIFVIVILGILASVAIPRLAATREDAEIATTVANLRTLVSEVSSYYVGHGTFTGANWNDVTNVPLKDHADAPITNQAVSREVYLYIGGTRCIGVSIRDRVRTIPAGIVIPAHIVFFTANPTTASDTCRQALAAEPIRAFTQSTIRVGSGTLPNAMAIGSTSRIYE
ncbi:prepilin-type N-terminal cleavage/methylation domain-containing protein [Campylobacter sp.]|uniref:type II secretion system protein n=1 Tax=Campylobacter sp. TaxID=205 RepID=UPI002A83DABF|nr:prepilin-type N-terminal cleavage/methylation domain-containing protein [Campylobacter sp.]MDY4153845.1 prepilin-type N-terminal cleavage/methylation domain-containing protein [Campylobacter sp.]